MSECAFVFVQEKEGKGREENDGKGGGDSAILKPSFECFSILLIS